MSTKSTIAYRDGTADEPHVHVYEDSLDWMRDAEPIIYVQFQGAVSVEFETLAGGRVAVTVGMPRKTAEAIGLIPAAKDVPGDGEPSGAP